MRLLISPNIMQLAKNLSLASAAKNGLCVETVPLSTLFKSIRLDSHTKLPLRLGKQVQQDLYGCTTQWTVCCGMC